MSVKPKYHKVIKEKINKDGMVNYTLAYNSELFKQASCIGTNSELYYPTEENYNPISTIARVCNGCPIKEQCLEWGLAHERYGTWGGTSAKARKIMRNFMGWAATEISLYPTREDFI